MIHICEQVQKIFKKKLCFELMTVIKANSERKAFARLIWLQLLLRLKNLIHISMIAKLLPLEENDILKMPAWQKNANFR